MIRLLAAALCLTAASAHAQTVTARPCDGAPEASILNLIEPLADTTRRYEEGAVRVLLLGTGEPPCCGFHIGILHPTAEGTPGCTIVVPETGGWANVAFGGEAAFAPETGVIVPLVVTETEDGVEFVERELLLTVDQAGGGVSLTAAE